MGVADPQLAALTFHPATIIVGLAVLAVVFVMVRASPPAGRKPRRTRPVLWGQSWLDSEPALHTPVHPPRSQPSRHSGSGAGDPGGDAGRRLRQLEKLHAKGHISDDDLARMRAETLGRGRGAY